MTEKTIAIMTALLGTAMVVSLTMLRTDVMRYAQIGPAWRRKMIASGLALLALLGLTSCKNDPDPGDVTCYAPVAIEDVEHKQTEKLAGQVELLREQLESGDLEVAVLTRVIGTVAEELLAFHDNAELIAGETETIKQLETEAKVLCAAAQRRLEENPAQVQDQLKGFARLWASANEIADGTRGDYPLDRDEKEELLAAIADADDQLLGLAVVGALPQSAVELLRLDFSEVTDGVNAKRTEDQQDMTCYFVGPLPYDQPLPTRIKQLSARLELLRNMTEEGELPDGVLEQVLISVDDDVAALSDDERLAQLNETERNRAIEIRNQVQELVTIIRQPAFATLMSAELTCSPMVMPMHLPPEARVTHVRQQVSLLRNEAELDLEVKKRIVDNIEQDILELSSKAYRATVDVSARAEFDESLENVIAEFNDWQNQGAMDE